MADDIEQFLAGAKPAPAGGDDIDSFLATSPAKPARKTDPGMARALKGYVPPEEQDKRSVIPVAFEDVDLWLHGRTEDVRSLLRLDERQPFEAGPADLDSGR